jgi:hypothetical protein
VYEAAFLPARKVQTEVSKQMIIRLIVMGFLLAVPALLQAQQSAGAAGLNRSVGVMPILEPEPDLDPYENPIGRRRLNILPPYAGKYEARIGGSTEPGRSRLRLDIGASADLVKFGGYYSRFGWGALGVDFFTWTRLRDAGGFKFPVEAVDYYFGINTTFGDITDLGLESRVRIAHISAHLVDGDPSFSTTTARYMTYSREFIDVMIG